MDQDLASKEKILEMYLDFTLGYYRKLRHACDLQGIRTWKDIAIFIVESFERRGGMGIAPRLTREEKAIWRRWREKTILNKEKLWMTYEKNQEYKDLIGKPWALLRELASRFPNAVGDSWNLKAALGAFEILCLVAEEEDPRLVPPVSGPNPSVRT
jgi:hypothetical protein